MPQEEAVEAAGAAEAGGLTTPTLPWTHNRCYEALRARCCPFRESSLPSAVAWLPLAASRHLALRVAALAASSDDTPATASTMAVLLLVGLRSYMLQLTCCAVEHALSTEGVKGMIAMVVVLVELWTCALQLTDYALERPSPIEGVQETASSIASLVELQCYTL